MGYQNTSLNETGNVPTRTLALEGRSSKLVPLAQPLLYELYTYIYPLI